LLRQSGISNFNSRNTVERFCNQFAAAFLLPVEAVEAAFPREVLEAEQTIPQLEAAAKKLCVTISQLARRLEDLGRTKTGYFNRFVSTLSPRHRKSLVRVGRNINTSTFPGLAIICLTRYFPVLIVGQ
jgi:Zn-dependent peptidase ImmA (M78 family)